MNYLIYSFLFASIVSAAYAGPLSRPEKLGGDYIFEFVAGAVFEGGHEGAVPEIGFDLEYFVEGYDHHLAIGISTELEQTDMHGSLNFIGPTVALYYYHIKTFASFGVLTDFSHYNVGKGRIGIGYEYFLDSGLILVPTIAVDRIQNHTFPALALGFAKEF